MTRASSSRFFVLTVVLSCGCANAAPVETARMERAVQHVHPAATADGRADARERARLAAQPHAHPDFASITSDSLRAALAEPASLWNFIVDPSTSHTERMAAAVQGARVLPFDSLPRLMSAIGELRREAAVHRWAIAPHPHDSAPDAIGVLGLDGIARERTVLGRAWSLPSVRTPFPLTWEEECAAPWPWQVAQALGYLFGGLVERGKFDGAGWHAAALTLPWNTDEAALLFLEASGANVYDITLPVLARWRAIALHPDMPKAASRVATELADVQRLWLDPRSGDFAALLALDVLRSSPHIEARRRAAYSVETMAHTVKEERQGPQGLRSSFKLPPLPPIAAALQLELGRAALAAREDEWTRLYVYVFSLCACLEPAPIAVDRSMNPRAPAVSEMLRAFEAWFHAAESGLAATARDDERRWSELRQLLR